MPVYRILFKLKFSTVSGHMIKCLLIEFGGAEQESIWLSVMKQGLQVVTKSQVFFSVSPYHSITKYTIFRFFYLARLSLMM